jgi:hypothetical protein
MPPLPFLGQILLRSAIVWAGLRVALFILFNLVLPSGVVSCAIVALTVFLIGLDGRRRNEHVFLANLGVSTFPITVAAAVVPLGAELAVRLLA